MQRILREEAGFTIVETLIAFLFLAVVALGSTQLIVRSGRSGLLIKANSAAQVARTRIIDAIQSENAWALTVAHSPQLACLQSKTDCSALAGSAIPVAIYELPASVGGTPTALTDPANASQGFTLTGDICTRYNPSGSPECPIQYTTALTVVCLPGVPCTNPQLRVSGTLATASFQGFDQNAAINIARHSFQMYRAPSSLSSNDACLAAGGTLDTTTTPGVTLCTPPFADQTCPAGQVVVSADYTTGKIQCAGPIPAFSCPSGTVPKGYDSSGNMQCVPINCTPTVNNPNACPGGCCNPPCLPSSVIPGASDGAGGGAGSGADGACGGSDGCGDGSGDGSGG